MSLRNNSDVIDQVQYGLGAVSDKVGDDGYDQAVVSALSELHWELPLDDSEKERWVIERTKRYVLYILLIESAHKFQFKKLYLQHRFTQYFKLIEFMDKEFANALENNPILFDVSAWGNLTFYITNGFDYDDFGRDISYDGWL